MVVSCLGRRPTEQVRSPSARSLVSAVNQPSKYDHAHDDPTVWPSTNRASTITGLCLAVRLGRQPTKQVRSHAEPPRRSLPRESRPSTNRASTITRSGAIAAPAELVSAVNQPSKYDHRQATVRSSTRTGSRPSTNRASTITGGTNDRAGRLRRVSAVNQPSKYDHRAS